MSTVQWRHTGEAYSPDLLISGEQFGLGGAHSIRGFEERELSADKGIQASLEIYALPLAGAQHAIISVPGRWDPKTGRAGRERC